MLNKTVVRHFYKYPSNSFMYSILFHQLPLLVYFTLHSWLLCDCSKWAVVGWNAHVLMCHWQQISGGYTPRPPFLREGRGLGNLAHPKNPGDTTDWVPRTSLPSTRNWTFPNGWLAVGIVQMTLLVINVIRLSSGQVTTATKPDLLLTLTWLNEPIVCKSRIDAKTQTANNLWSYQVFL